MLKKILLGTLLAGTTLLPFDSKANIYTLDSVEWNGSTYHLTNPGTWPELEAFAQSTYSAHLVTVNSAAENDFLYSLWGARGSGNFNYEWLFIGLSDIETEGAFKWSSGEAFDFYNFSNGEPNNSGNEDYVHIWSAPSNYASFGWNDIRNTHITAGIVEVKNNVMGLSVDVPVPLAAGGLLVGLLGFRLAALSKVKK